MSTCDQFVLMAAYNEWMNAKLYDAAAKLSPQELAADRKAFFRSIIGTLNHIVVADIYWLKRFATHPSHCASLDPLRQMPAPVALDQILYDEIGALSDRRKMLDGVIQKWSAALRAEDLHHVLRYTNSRGVAGTRRFSSLVMHFYNHQTHHRGQATTLLFQAGVDVGVTDLLALIPNESDA
jgi:uncharacterized damage-inducible protein DinB